MGAIVSPKSRATPGQLLEPHAQAAALFEPAHGLNAPAAAQLPIEAVPTAVGMLVIAACLHLIGCQRDSAAVARQKALAARCNSDLQARLSRLKPEAGGATMRPSSELS